MNRRSLLLVACLIAGTAVELSPLQSAHAQAERRECTVEERDINADCRSHVGTKNGKSPKDAANIDVTGYWASVVTEDWRWRVVTPPKGDFASIPLNPEGQKVANTWDPAKAATDCKYYGAAGLLRNPLRVHLSWKDAETLLLETDHGKQTRVLNFTSAGGHREPSMQGHSVAAWEAPSLKVVTTGLLPGYLRKNGVPYSERTVLTEYFNRYSAFGAEWLTVTTVVQDPTYLSREFITSSHFKRLANGSDWNPTACGAT